jgi:hypothetical protein
MKRILGMTLGVAIQLCGVEAIAAIDHQYVPATTNVGAGVGFGIGLDGVPFEVEQAQTFTVGITGLFTGFDIWMTRDRSTTLPVLFDIRRTVSGAPTESNSGADILAAGSIDTSQFDISFTVPNSPPSVLPHVELNQQSFNVVVGDVLALTLRSDAVAPDMAISPLSWRGNLTGQYANGAEYHRVLGAWQMGTAGLQDQVFRTYVTAVPEPSSVLLVITAAICLRWSLRMRKRHY